MEECDDNCPVCGGDDEVAWAKFVAYARERIGMAQGEFVADDSI